MQRSPLTSLYLCKSRVFVKFQNIAKADHQQNTAKAESQYFAFMQKQKTDTLLLCNAKSRQIALMICHLRSSVIAKFCQILPFAMFCNIWPFACLRYSISRDIEYVVNAQTAEHY